MCESNDDVEFEMFETSADVAFHNAEFDDDQNIRMYGKSAFFGALEAKREQDAMDRNNAARDYVAEAAQVAYINAASAALSELRESDPDEFVRRLFK